MNDSLLRTSENYTALGRGLCSIATVDPHRGKRPQFLNWQKDPRTAEDLRKQIAKGHNVGFVMGEADLVIDVDPRNGGLEGLVTLLSDVGYVTIGDMARDFPVVKTGADGYHIYTTIPEGLKVRNTVDRYGDGVEFKPHGRQVIIPGSIHPVTGRPYKWLTKANETQPSTPCPLTLLSIIERKIDKSKRNVRQPNDETYCTPEGLTAILAQIPVGEINTDPEWFKVLCASHHATGGEGLAEFVAWSQSYDGGTPKTEHEITTRWHSLSLDGDELVTAGTLVQILRNHGGTLPGDVGPSDPLGDFEGLFIGDSNDDLIELLELREERRVKMATERKERKAFLSGDGFDALIDGPVGAPIKLTAKGNPTRAKASLVSDEVLGLKKEIALLTPSTDNLTITKLLRQIAKTDQLQKMVLIRDFAKNTGITRGDIKAALANIGRKKGPDKGDVDDLSLNLSTTVRNAHYRGGDYLVRTRGLWYRYNGKNWEPIEDDLIDKACLKTIVTYKRDNQDDETPVASLMPSVERILRARQAAEGDPFRLNKIPQSIINVSNGELHINPDGSVDLKPHSFDSYLLQCLNRVSYRPEAECPLMDQTLKEIFKKDDFADETIRHFWEMLGYTIQPKKDIPVWFLLHGSGSNGKTALMKIMIELMGDACVQMAIHSFNSSTAPHALSVLPGKLALIDDDVKKDVVLPDDFMKSVSENKALWANPKGDKYFPFISSLTPILAANHFPKVKDLSEGMVRRAFVIPFTRRFSESNRDNSRADNIIKDELPGILNKALEGLRRLRDRGHFVPSESCKLAKKSWLYGANTTAAFMQDCIKKDASSRMSVEAIYERYCDWCDDQELDHKYRLTKRAMSESFVSMGFERGRASHGGNRAILGVRLKEFKTNG